MSKGRTHIDRTNWTHLILAIMSSGMMMISAPLADVIFVSHTNPERRGTIMAFSRITSGVPNIFIPMMSAAIVASSGAVNARSIDIQLVLSVFVLFSWP